MTSTREGLRDPRADPGDHAIVSAAAKRSAAASRLMVGSASTRTDPTPTCASTTSTRAPPPGARRRRSAVVLVAEQIHVAEPNLGPYARRRRRAARSRAGRRVDAGWSASSRRPAGGRSQVEVEVADAEPVAPLEVGAARRRVCLVADSVAEMHREDRRRRSPPDQHHGDQAAEHDQDRPAERDVAGRGRRDRGCRSLSPCDGRRSRCRAPRRASEQEIAPPASRTSIQAASPGGQKLTRESSTHRPPRQPEADQRPAGGPGSGGAQPRRSSLRCPRPG